MTRLTDLWRLGAVDMVVDIMWLVAWLGEVFELVETSDDIFEEEEGGRRVDKYIIGGGTRGVGCSCIVGECVGVFVECCLNSVYGCFDVDCGGTTIDV